MLEIADGVFRSNTETDAFEPDGEMGGLVHVVRGDDDVQAGLWQAPDGLPPFEVELDHHETVLVLEGSVEIEIEDGPTFELRPGDIASFRRGIRSTWRPEPGFKELWVFG